MRDYGKISPSFWTGKTGKAIKAGGQEAVVVAMYLMSSPHSNMIGLYYLPMMYLAHETGMGFEGASKGLQRACEAGFCSYDEASEVVWVHEMARYQIADELKANDLRTKGVQREIDSVPENPFISAFYDRYGIAFNLKKQAEKASPLQAPSKPLRSQEQEQEQEQDKTLLSESDDSNSLPAETKTDNVVQIDSAKPQIPYQQIIDAYHEALPELPRAVLMSESRKRLIKSRWLEMLKSKRPDGTRRYTDVESGVEWWALFFKNAGTNRFWMGENSRGWTANLDWLLKHHGKVIEHNPRASA